MIVVGQVRARQRPTRRLIQFLSPVETIVNLNVTGEQFRQVFQKLWPIIGLKKDVRKNDVPYTQTVWLTVTQLRGLAIEETF